MKKTCNVRLTANESDSKPEVLLPLSLSLSRFSSSNRAVEHTVHNDVPELSLFQHASYLLETKTGAKVEIQYRYATSSDVKVFKENYVSRRMWQRKKEADNKR